MIKEQKFIRYLEFEINQIQKELILFEKDWERIEKKEITRNDVEERLIIRAIFYNQKQLNLLKSILNQYLDMHKLKSDKGRKYTIHKSVRNSNVITVCGKKKLVNAEAHLSNIWDRVNCKSCVRCRSFVRDKFK